jgi:DNA-binding NtrC family response regulator
MPPDDCLLALTPPGNELAVTRAAAAAGLEPSITSTLPEFLAHLSERPWVATLLSLTVDPVDEAVARRVGERPGSGTLLLSARGASIERALLMERVGAVALLREPLGEEDLRTRLEGVVEEGAEVPLDPPYTGAPGDFELVGDSPAMADVFETLARVARSSATVLVTGESGTGKELVARALHGASERRDGPFVPVNCAAIPEHLLESELFGHERGAFTGAVARRIGRFERAHGGTLFLDEIGDMSLVLQAKILRVLEERSLERVGAEGTTTVDVRVVAATHQELSRRIEEGEFREDLYYRLAVVELRLPPLRERGRDIRKLGLHFAAHFAERYDRPVSAVTETALRRLEAHLWPGNVRELRNVLDRAVLLAGGSVLRSGDLRLGAGSPHAAPRSEITSPAPYPPTLSLQEVEADHIRRVIAFTGGRMGQAAKILGIHRNTLTRKASEFGLDSPGEAEPGA